MSRLPNPGGDDGQWGTILNDFLVQAHDADGTLKAGAVSSSALTDGSVTAVKLSAPSPSIGQVLSYDGTALAWATASGSGSVPDASTSTKGLIQLAGDLAGTAAAPTVPGLAAKAPLANPTFTGTVTVPTPATGPAAANKTYVDTAVSTATVADATTTTKGKIQLAGDLAGTAAAPTVPGLAAKATDSAVVHLTGSETITGVKNFTGTLQSGGQAVVATNDARLSDQRVPTANSVSYAKLSATGATTGQVLAYDGTNLIWTTPASGAGDATTSTNGVVRLAGDLGGTAAAPSVLKVKGITLPASAPTTGQVLTATSASATSWSTPSGGGGNGGRTVTAVKTSAYTPAAGEYVIVNPTTSGFTVTLPTAQASGAWVSLKNIGTNSNSVLIVPGGTDKIEDTGNYDGLSVSLNSGQTDMDFIYDGTSRWYRVG